MDKIDRLGWTAGISIAAYGRSVGIRVNQPAILESLTPCLPFGWRPSRKPAVERLYSLYVGGPARSPHMRCFHVLYQGTLRLARTESMDQLLAALATDLRTYVAEHARQRVFVHCGVVGWQGRAILIPGRSFSGKSTLTAELVRAGATYYSDEYAVLDPRGRVHPFLKPLSLRNGGVEQTDVSATQLGGISGRRPLPVGLVVVGSYREAARWRPRAQSSGQGVLALLANTVAVRQQPEVTLATLEKALAGAAVLKSDRGEAAETAPDILARLAPR